MYLSKPHTHALIYTCEYIYLYIYIDTRSDMSEIFSVRYTYIFSCVNILNMSS